MKYILVSLTAAILIIGVCIYVYKWEYREEVFEVGFMNLNRGRAVFVRTPGNKTVLVGGGQNSEVIRELTKMTPFYDRKIDYLFVPSATPSQIGGLLEVIDRYEIGEVLIPTVFGTSTVLDLLEKKIRKNKIHVRRVSVGDVISIDKLDISILFPVVGFKYNKTSLPELVLSIRYGNTDLYLIGNVSKTIQKYIGRYMEIGERQSLVEYYNTASESKVSPELKQSIDPVYVHSTKEKSTRWISDGFFWIKRD